MPYFFIGFLFLLSNVLVLKIITLYIIYHPIIDSYCITKIGKYNDKPVKLSIHNNIHHHDEIKSKM
jgi:hypothetical protein